MQARMVYEDSICTVYIRIFVLYAHYPPNGFAFKVVQQACCTRLTQ